MSWRVGTCIFKVCTCIGCVSGIFHLFHKKKQFIYSICPINSSEPMHATGALVLCAQSLAPSIFSRAVPYHRDDDLMTGRTEAGRHRGSFPPPRMVTNWRWRAGEQAARHAGQSRSLRTATATRILTYWFHMPAMVTRRCDGAGRIMHMQIWETHRHPAYIRRKM